MARMSLRAYNHEIENLIDRGQIEEAIAHCKNIIKQFPKHIETYRLLGKAFLESQRYAEAADILQRVLSVYPDDFVSQLGMSIIREDEGNLDASIWHMERAYEVQPFNRAVQDELRRLYGRRDGVEPPRIRLTRGALVRMYARGDLYPQAIAEIRAALAEDQKRVDLLVLLSRMYYLSGQKIEATEICSSLISKLPYCYEANRTLKEVLPETSRAEDARIFQQRLFALDPYAAFISPNAPTSAQVPEQTVMVEKVEWQPNMPDSQSPDWARTIGVRWEDSPEEALPDWLNTISPGDALQEPTVELDSADLVEPPSSAGDELLPEFMKDAGWESSDGTTEGNLAGMFAEAAPPTEEELAEADIPDWLKTLAPESVSGSAETEPEDSASLEWLSGILPPAAVAAAGEPAVMDETTQKNHAFTEAAPLDQADFVSDVDATQGFPSEEDEISEAEAVPDWLQDMSSSSTLEDEDLLETSIAGVAESVPGEEIPDWLETLQPASLDETTVLDENTPVIAAQDSQETLPDWIQQAQEELPSDQAAEIVPAQDQPDWLKELANEESPVETDSSLVETYETVLPTQVEASTAPEASTSTGANIDEMDIDSAMAWMEALAAKQGADEESLKISSPEQRSDVAPEWIQRQSEASDELIDEEEAVLPVEELAAEPEMAAQISLETIQMDELEQDAQVLEITEPASQESAPDTDDMDAAMAWMEALAAKQGADEDSLKISTPEARSETPPDWVLQQTEDVTPDVEPMVVDEVEAGTSSILQGDTEQTGLAETAAELQEETAVAEVDELEVSNAAEIVDEAAEIAPPETSDDQQNLPSWITELANEPTVDEAGVETDAVSIVPSASTETEFGQPVEAATSEPVSQENEPTGEPAADIPDWLRTYEDEQKRQEPVWRPDESFTPEAVAEDELPAWLRAEGETQPPVEIDQPEPVKSFADEPVESTSDAVMPDWLKELQDTAPEKGSEPSETTAESSWISEYQPAAVDQTHSSGMESQTQSGGDHLALARASMRGGDLDNAVTAYNECINAGERVDDVIDDLKSALDQHPIDVGLWQALGDAYMRQDQIQAALDAYTKAEELLR